MIRLPRPLSLVLILALLISQAWQAPRAAASAAADARETIASVREAIRRVEQRQLDLGAADRARVEVELGTKRKLVAAMSRMATEIESLDAEIDVLIAAADRREEAFEVAVGALRESQGIERRNVLIGLRRDAAAKERELERAMSRVEHKLTQLDEATERFNATYWAIEPIDARIKRLFEAEARA